MIDSWIMTATDNPGYYYLTDADHFSATVRWEFGMEAPIVRGMPYATMKYEGATPVLQGINAILDFNGALDPVTDTRFEVELNSGEIWIIYTSSEITFEIDDTSLVIPNEGFRMITT